MSEPDNFLARWSRRKREIADVEKDAKTLPSDAQPAEPDKAVAPAAEPPRADSDATPFDLSSLPSVESITADTDIRCFFAPGVPEDIARAALRRAWAVDPHIRDFVGLEDYAWDFNNPESIPGFGKLEMTDDLRREVQRIVGNFVPEDEPAGDVASAVPQQQPETAQELTAVRREAEPVVEVSEEPETIGSGGQPETRQYSDEFVGTSASNTAVQQSAPSAENLQPSAKRVHGGALPK
jgi:hypothetical protein